MSTGRQPSLISFRQVDERSGADGGKSAKDVELCVRRVDEELDQEWPVTRLLDLRNSYTWMGKPELLNFLEKYSTNSKCLENLTGISFKV